MKKFRFLKIFFTFATVILLVLTPCIRSYAIDADHVKIGVDEVGRCFDTTYETFNYIAFLCKHPEIGYPDKETAWAYYEMYCMPKGELAPCNLKMYMDYTEFDIDYFIVANGLNRTGLSDQIIFDTYCDYCAVYNWDARGLTTHAEALIRAYEYFWKYNISSTGSTTLQTIVNYYMLPSLVIEYYTVDPYTDPTNWDIVTSIEGPMLYGLGNCQAYAKFYMMLLDFFGEPSRTVYSETHMWNEVLYNGNWYVCDTCWADISYNHTSAMLNWCMVTY